jgi:hypothetical protein
MGDNSARYLGFQPRLPLRDTVAKRPARVTGGEAEAADAEFAPNAFIRVELEKAMLNPGAVAQATGDVGKAMAGAVRDLQGASGWAKNGAVRVRGVVCAVDCGIAVNPDTIGAQIQSAVVFGITAALHGEITLNDGRVQQTNFVVISSASMPAFRFRAASI